MCKKFRNYSSIITQKNIDLNADEVSGIVHIYSHGLMIKYNSSMEKR